MNYQERFKALILRMKKNSKRYNEINLRTETDDEKRIFDICKKFWGNNNLDLSGFNIKDDMDPHYAHKLLDELESILNNLEW